MSRVMYNGKRLIPAPLVTVAKEFQSTSDGTKVGSSFNLTINGTCVAFKGSPDSSGTFWESSGFPPDEIHGEDSRLKSCLRKQEAIRELFSTDGYTLEFQSEDGSPPMKCNPKIVSINFSEGIWYDRFEYSIVVTADVLSVNGVAVGEDDFSEFISSAEENWQIEESDEPESLTSQKKHSITHTVGATGKRVFDDTGTLIKPAWQQARDWVSSRKGIDSSIITNSLVTALSGKTAYNYLISENIGELDGSYSITESWVFSVDSAHETLEVTATTSADTGVTEVSVTGTVTGLRTDSASKYENALSKFNTVIGLAITRAATYSGNSSLNVIPLSTSVGKNPISGIINYTYTYNDRPTNLISGSKSESITIADNLPTDFPVPIFVLGREGGPIIQNLDTSKEKRRTLTIEAVMDVPTGGIASRISAAPDVSSIETAANPGGTAFIEDKNRTWDITNGRFTYTVTWLWEE